MWIKLCLLLVYICLLFLLTRFLETISWCDMGPSRVLSRQLLDPMRMSVAKLKCLLDHRGVSYNGVVEKSELTGLVEDSGPINLADVDMSCEEQAIVSETNFTSGAHFIEQVEDAKDSVWLVHVVTQTDQVRVVVNKRWRDIQRKASRFGVRTGILDCSLDVRYCYSKGWKMPVMLLALPRVFEKKANVVLYNYSGPIRESAVMNWIHDKLDENITRIKDVSEIRKDFPLSMKNLQPEIKATLFTQTRSAPLFFSALSFKFPGRVKFGILTVDKERKLKNGFFKTLGLKHIMHFPIFTVYTSEGNYTYGYRRNEKFSFNNIEIFLRFLYPCLNDIFIISFFVANITSFMELFISNCSIFRRLRKFIWCFFKYNVMVILLWLPVIGIFQMPYLDNVPLILLKLHRIFTTSKIGAILRGDYVYFVNHPIYIYISFVAYLISVTLLCKKYRNIEEDSDEWFNFRHMQSFTHLRANNLFEPMRVSSYDLVGGIEVFGSRFSQHSLWLQPSIPLEYIQYLPTWRYVPQSLAARAAENVRKVEEAMNKPLETKCTKHLNSLFEAGTSASSNNDNSSTVSNDQKRSCSCKCTCLECGPDIKNGSSTDYDIVPLMTPQSLPSTTTNISSGCPSCGCATFPCNSCKAYVHSDCICSLQSDVAATPSTNLPSRWCSNSESGGPTVFCNTASHQPTSPSPLTHNMNSACVTTASTSVSTRSAQTVSAVNMPTNSATVLSDLSPSLFPNAEINPSSIMSPPSLPTPPHQQPSPAQSSSSTTPPEIQSNHSIVDAKPQTNAMILPNGFRKGYMECAQCVICLEEFSPLVMLCGLPCGHVFHESCIIAWLNREKHFCPMCRWPSYKLVSQNPS